jgi:hypothetical protein
MKILKIVGFTLGLVVLVVFIGGLLLPDKVHIEREIVIKSTAEKVYPNLINYRNFNKWSPWYKLDPTAEYDYSGPSDGVGATMSWRGDDRVGEGVQKIVEAQPYQHVKASLDFGSQGNGFTDWYLTNRGNEVSVKWSFDTEFNGNIFGRWFGLFVDRMIGKDYEKGLQNLKKVVESSQ